MPMPDPNPAPDEPKEYARGDAGIVAAANDQTKSRGSTEDPLDILFDKRQPEEGKRKYYDTVEDAAHDLSVYHRNADATQAVENLTELAREVDLARAQVAGPEHVDALARLQAQACTKQKRTPAPNPRARPSLKPQLLRCQVA